MAMKRNRKTRWIFLLLALLLLTACSHTGGKPPLPEAAQDSYPFNQTAWENYLTTESVVYHRNGAILTFRPSGDDRFYPLCGKPDCDHQSPDCNAWLGHGSGVGYWKGRLYAVTPSPENPGRMALLSMAPTGEDHRIELELPTLTYADGSEGGASYYIFHENRLICFLEPAADVPLEEQHPRLCVVALDTLAMTEPFSGWLDASQRVQMDAKAAGNCLYARVEERSAQGSSEQWLCELNLDTGAKRRLVHSDGLFQWSVENGVLYFLLPDVGFCEYELQTDSVRELGLPDPDLVWAVHTPQGSCAISRGEEDAKPQTCYFYDAQYRLQDQLVLTQGLWPCYFDETRIWFASTLDPTDSAPVAYLERSRIGSGNLALTPCGAQ